MQKNVKICSVMKDTPDFIDIRRTRWRLLHFCYWHGWLLTVWFMPFTSADIWVRFKLRDRLVNCPGFTVLCRLHTGLIMLDRLAVGWSQSQRRKAIDWPAANLEPRILPEPHTATSETIYSFEYKATPLFIIRLHLFSLLYSVWALTSL